MRPTVHWQEVSQQTARLLRRHDVRTKKVWVPEQRVCVYLAPLWAVNCLLTKDRCRRPSQSVINITTASGRRRRALRRAVRDVMFRDALLAAIEVGLGDVFIVNQGE